MFSGEWLKHSPFVNLPLRTWQYLLRFARTDHPGTKKELEAVRLLKNTMQRSVACLQEAEDLHLSPNEQARLAIALTAEFNPDECSDITIKLINKYFGEFKPTPTRRK